MISIFRIVAVVKRHMHLQFRDNMRLSDIIYWPVIDVVLWGGNGAWMATLGSQQYLMQTLVISAFLWQVALRANLELSTNLLEEMWERNMLNLFCSPLSFFEWIIALFIVSLIRIAIVFGVCVFVTQYVFNVSIFSLGYGPLMIILLALTIAGWGMGCLNSSIIIRMGRRAQNFPWIFSWLFAPMCGVFSDISILPMWLQYISACIPLTPIFQAVRILVRTGVFEYSLIQKSIVLGIIYLVAGYVLFLRLFDSSKQRGLTTLE